MSWVMLNKHAKKDEFHNKMETVYRGTRYQGNVRRYSYSGAGGLFSPSST